MSRVSEIYILRKYLNSFELLIDKQFFYRITGSNCCYGFFLNNTTGKCEGKDLEHWKNQSSVDKYMLKITVQ